LRSLDFESSASASSATPAAGKRSYGVSAEAQALAIRSSGCKLRGGPKISRKIIASRKPDLDLSNAAISAFDCSGLAAGSGAIAKASADLAMTGGAG
jgi:hypothetical protein